MAPKKSTTRRKSRVKLFAKIIFIPVASLYNSKKSVKVRVIHSKEKPISTSIEIGYLGFEFMTFLDVQNLIKTFSLHKY